MPAHQRKDQGRTEYRPPLPTDERKSQSEYSRATRTKYVKGPVSLHDSTKGQLLSVVVPCFNEEAVIRQAHTRLTEVLSGMEDLSYELIYVDDGSRDSSLRILKEIQSGDERVRIVSFSRNFGHQRAVTAGLEHASGDAVVLIDADLQDPPEVIGEMVELWRSGVEVAYGVRTERDRETAFKLWSARIFYRTMNRMSEVPIPLDTGDFRLMSRKVVEALLTLPERDRFLRGMVSWVGFRQEPVFYKRAARLAGKTKYPFAKMVRFATDGILSFSLAPLRFAILIGVTTATLSLMGILYAIAMRLFTSIPVPGWTFLLIALLFIGGVQLIFLGIVGEYIGRVYGEVKQRPLYIVRERLGFKVDKPLMPSKSKYPQ